MEDLDWLTELVSDFCAFGEKHGLKHIEDGAQAIVDALERDLGLKFLMLSRNGHQTSERSREQIEAESNILPFPWRGRKLAKSFKCACGDLSQT